MKKNQKREKKIKLDKTNLKILNSFLKDGKINYSKLGKKLGLSHVAIKYRYEGLLKKNIIKPSFLFNFGLLDYSLGIILLEIEQGRIEKLLKLYKSCPRLIYSYNVIGEYNVILVFFAETRETLETMVNSCMLYNLEGVRKSNILIIGKLNEEIYLPINFQLLNQTNENTPCGTCCNSCKSFIKEKCIGCPGSKYYKGTLRYQQTL